MVTFASLGCQRNSAHSSVPSWTRTSESRTLAPGCNSQYPAPSAIDARGSRESRASHLSAPAIRRSGVFPRPARYPRRSLAGWVLGRLLAGVATLFVVSVVVFGATQALPGDPARAVLGTQATPERLEALQKDLGLDRPVVEQYTDWLKGVVTGDFGESLNARIPVSELIGSRLLNSLVLVAIAAALSIPLSILLGVYSAVHRDSLFDRVTLSMTLLLNSLPLFVIGMLLVIVFATTVLQLVPGVAIIPPGETPFMHLDALVLPAATLVLAGVPYLSRFVRGAMIEALNSDYVEMARLKGVPERAVVYRHALPNALIPAIQASALLLAYLLSGILAVEYLFGYPGLGTALVNAVTGRDLPVVQAVTLIFATGIVIFNILADVLTVLVTPKLRTSMATR
jgi:peptide/nickel transport system permease protein